MLGTLARYALENVVPAPDKWPLPTLLINVSGALLLGMLLEGLARRGDDSGHRRVLRLLLGTGVMGAFTTYSTLALEANMLLDGQHLGQALLYLGLSLIGGVMAAALGIWVAVKVFPHHGKQSRWPEGRQP